MNYLNQSVGKLTGIGAQTVNRLEKLGIRVIQDLIFHLPLRYEDRTRIYPIGSLMAGMTALICGRVEFIDILPRGRKSLICRISDGTGFISLKFFHFSANQHNILKPGTLISCFAEVRYGFAGLEMVHPDYQVIANPEAHVTETRLTPVYPLTEGLSQTTLRKAVKHALSLCNNEPQLLVDWIPEAILKKYHYPSLAEAVQTLHAPDESVSIEALQNGSVPALKRLAFEELLAHHLSLRLTRNKTKAWLAPVFADSSDKTITEQFLGSLPFKLTGAQQRVISRNRRGLPPGTSDDATGSGRCRLRQNHCFCLRGLTGVNGGLSGRGYGAHGITGGTAQTQFQRVVCRISDQSCVFDWSTERQRP